MKYRIVEEQTIRENGIVNSIFYIQKKSFFGWYAIQEFIDGEFHIIFYNSLEEAKQGIGFHKKQTVTKYHEL